MLSEFSVGTVASTERPLAECFLVLETFTGFLTSGTGSILSRDF